ncbi:hypothetical protein [Streptomyces sp. NPDC059649]|uniref:hypothetical protein n=1 Tax=Streptomyces sp. NPDC059649 TaxID=3346895 RepID=UPI003693A88D
MVEAGLPALPVWYGLTPGSAIGATLPYRAVSYWALQLVGWAAWLGMTLRNEQSEASAPPGESSG